MRINPFPTRFQLPISRRCRAAQANAGPPGNPEAGSAAHAVPGDRKQSKLVSELLEVSSISKPSHSFPFTRPSAGWIFMAATCQGKGTVHISLDQEPSGDVIVVQDADGSKPAEAMRRVAKG